jgi:hypothetical protein
MRDAGGHGEANSGQRKVSWLWACNPKAADFAEAALFGPAGLVWG